MHKNSDNIQHSPFETAWPPVNFPPCNCHSQHNPFHVFQMLSLQGSWCTGQNILCPWFPFHHHHSLFLQFLQIILSNFHLPGMASYTVVIHKSTVPLLSNSNTIGNATFKPTDYSSLFTFIISCALLVAAISSASVTDKATIFCIVLC